MVRATLQELAYILQVLQPYKGMVKVDALIDEIVLRLRNEVEDEESTLEPVDKTHGKKKG